MKINPPATDMATTLKQAAGLIQAGRAPEAAALCQQVLKTTPNQPDALHLLAMATASQGDPVAAEKLFLKSLSSTPRRPDVLANFGDFLRQQGKLSEARSRLRKAVKFGPEFVPGWYKLATLMRATGDLREAARCARRVTELAPRYPAGWELLAALEQQRGRVTEAIAACRAGLKQEQKAPRLHYSLAQLLRQDCEFDDAAAAYEAALELGFNTPDLYLNRAEALLEAGDITQAMECATSGVDQYPEHAQLQRTRARLHWTSGSPGDPVATLWEAARNKPGNAALWYNLVQLLVRLKREEDSNIALGEARQLGCPPAPEILMLEAMSMASEGNTDRATEQFSRLVESNPDNNHVKLTFAQHLLTSGDPTRAERLCASALERSPYDQLAWAYRGTAWQLLGDEREEWLLDYDRMIMPTQVPTPEGYASSEAFFADVRDVLETFHRTEAHPIEQSLRGGTQTNGFLFRLKHPLLRVLEQQIRLAVASRLSEFPDDPNHPFWGRHQGRSNGDDFRFVGAWSVRLRNEGFHTNHIHTEGWISSALYIALPDEMLQQPGNPGQIQFGTPMNELDLPLPPRRMVRPEVGTLVLFPSYMWHGTVPFTSQQPRMTVAFDLLPQP